MLCILLTAIISKKWKESDALAQLLTIFAKKFYHKSLTGSWIPLWSWWICEKLFSKPLKIHAKSASWSLLIVPEENYLAKLATYFSQHLSDASESGVKKWSPNQDLENVILLFCKSKFEKLHVFVPLQSWKMTNSFQELCLKLFTFF